MSYEMMYFFGWSKVYVQRKRANTSNVNNSEFI